MIFPVSDPPLLIAISGPAGSGKTTLCEGMTDKYSRVQRVVTCTTRPPRKGEKNGVDYHFFSKDSFEDAVRRNAFIEYAKVHDRYYGTLMESITGPLQAGRDLILSIDVQGAASLRAEAAANPVLAASLVTVFVMPENLDAIRARLAGRGTDDTAEIEKRMETAAEEIRGWSEYDYCLISRAKEEDFRRIESIWLSEKMRVPRLRSRQ
ncbi:MAG: guanylate kinase [Opitutales bacterium]